MVHIDVVRSSNSTLIKTQPLVAVFVGGTSGIGEYTIRALAATHSDRGKGLRVYIAGRNAAAAEKTISDCVRICPAGQFHFVQAQDLSLLKDVDRVCAEIVRLEEEQNANGGNARVDILVMSQATFLLPRKETKEGIEENFSLLYYSRMRFIMKLLPLLLASPLPAHVVSVYAAGTESKLFPEDLSLRNPKHQGFFNARSHVVYMKTLFMENLAEQNRGRLSLVHCFPGLVITDGMTGSRLPTWFKITWRLLGPFARLIAIPPHECGERILFLATSTRYPARQMQDASKAPKIGQTTADGDNAGVAVGTDGVRGSGAYAVTWNGEVTPTTEKAYKKVREEGISKKVWDHTMRAFDEIEAGRVFTG